MTLRRLLMTLFAIMSFQIGIPISYANDLLNSSGTGDITPLGGRGGSQMVMQAPRTLINRSSSLGWTTIAIPEAPEGAGYVMLQYAFQISSPDGVGNSYIYGRKDASSPHYLIAGMRCAGDADACGGAGQAFIPLNEDKTIQMRVTRTIYGGSYSLAVIGFM